MPIDVARLRADTPGCEQVVHLNNAGSSLQPEVVVRTVVDHLRLEASAGGYEAAARVAGALDDSRRSMAALLTVDDADVALTQSDTASWSKAFWGLALTGWFRAGDRVLVDRWVYHSHYLALLQARDTYGITIETIGAAPDGTIDLVDLDRRLDDSVRMVTATHVGTHRGAVNPVAEIGARTRALACPFFLDACQSAGQIVLDLGAIGCDVATGTGRKFLRGPRGTGWLYVDPAWSQRMSPPGIDASSATWIDADQFTLAGAARRFDEFEYSHAARLGLGAAADYALGIGVDEIQARIDLLAETCRAMLVAHGAVVRDGGTERSGIVTFTLAGADPTAIMEHLGANGVNVSVASPDYARLDMEDRGVPAAVRVSPHAFNTIEELERLVELLPDPVPGLD